MHVARSVVRLSGHTTPLALHGTRALTKLLSHASSNAPAPPMPSNLVHQKNMGKKCAYYKPSSWIASMGIYLKGMAGVTGPDEHW